jgi:hypothetical protein
VPRIAGLGLALHALFPDAVEKAVLHLVREWHFDFAPERFKTGNLFLPTGQAARVHGERPARTSFSGMLAWAALHFLRVLAEGTRAEHASLRPHSGV